MVYIKNIGYSRKAVILLHNVPKGTNNTKTDIYWSVLILILLS